MDPIFQEFEQDLARVVCQLDLIEKIRSFAQQDIQNIEADQENSFFAEALNVHKISRDAHISLPILIGTLVLYLAGRFEEFVMTLFEDLCQRLVQRATTFDYLPKKMQENLFVFTALVIRSPRQYGYPENGVRVRTFITTLSENIKGENPLSRVNHECLSITESNMRDKTLSDLFERIGISSIWKDISQQASILAHFETRNPSEAENKAKKYLNDIMDQRNLVAHPSGTINWPSPDTVRRYIEYLKVLGRALADLIGVYEVVLCQPVAPNNAE